MLFHYRAKDASGKILEGNIEADSIVTAASKLRHQQLFITRLQPNNAAAKNIVLRQKNKPRKVTQRDLELFCRQLAALLNAGVPILSAINVLADQVSNRHLKPVLKGVEQKLKGGQGFSNALRQYPNIFPTILTSMVEAGEYSGRLDSVLLNIADYFEQQRKIKTKMRTALIYPTIVITLAVIMVVFILVFALPRYVEMLETFAVELPLITQILITVSSFIINYGFIIVLFLTIVLASLKLLKKTNIFKEIFHQLLFHLPLAAGITRGMVFARFSRTLGLLLQSGIPLLQGLELTKGVVNCLPVAKIIAAAQANLQRGGTLSEALAKDSVFPPIMLQIITIGEQSGQLETQLEKVAAIYEQDIETAINRISPVLEPLLLLMASLFVGTVIIAVMLPIFTSLGAVTDFH